MLIIFSQYFKDVNIFTCQIILYFPTCHTMSEGGLLEELTQEKPDAWDECIFFLGSLLVCLGCLFIFSAFGFCSLLFIASQSWLPMDDSVCLYENSLFSFCAPFIVVDCCLFLPGPAPGCLLLQWTQFVGQLREVRFDLNPKLRRVQF